MQVYVEFRHKSFFFLQNNNQNAGGYTCLVKKIEITDPILSKIQIVGNHQPNESNRTVVGISIRNETQLQKFPRGFGEIFPNLKYFEIDNSSITMLRREDFLDLGHLQGLWLPRNPIVALPNDLFMNIQGLRYISFHKNKLKYIGKDILKPLKNLERANFEENTMIDMSYNGGADNLAALNNEIALKCISPGPMKITNASSNTIADMQKHIQSLELRVQKMDSDNKTLTAKLNHVSEMMDIIQARMIVVEEQQHAFY